MGIAFDSMAPLIQVFDMPTSLRFYRDVLGFDVVADSGRADDSDWVWLRRGAVHLMLNTAYEPNARPALPDPVRATNHADTGLFFSCRQVDDAYEYLKARGVRMDPPRDAAYGMRQLYVADPDGYMLCFQWRSNDAAGARWHGAHDPS